MSPPVPVNSTYEALCEALDDEYKARATYRAVIAKFGPVFPFANIVESEQRHIEALLFQFLRFGWDAPADRWTGQVASPPSVAEACRIGVQAELDNVALYDRLTGMTADAGILNVFANLRHASLQRHLPAFRRGADAAEPRLSRRPRPAPEHRGRAGSGHGCCRG